MSVGLNIGTTTIKVAELEGQGDKFSLKAAGALGHSGAAFDRVQDERLMSEMASIIKKLWADAKVSSKNVALSLPESQVFTRLLKFPLLNDQEIASAVKWEAEEYIPIPLAEAVVEHQIVERREDSTPPQVLVLLVAAPKALVQKYIKIVSLAGLTATSVETELLAATRAVSIPGKTILLTDIGANTTDIAVVKGEQLILTRSIPTGGAAITRAVAQGLGTPLPQAEEYKRTYGLEEAKLEGKVYQTIAPVVKAIVEEIKKAVHYYQSEVKGEAPVSAVLYGGSAGIPGLTPFLSNLLGMEVIVANAFSKVTVNPGQAKNLSAFAPLYPVPVGLAMRNE